MEAILSSNKGLLKSLNIGSKYSGTGPLQILSYVMISFFFVGGLVIMFIAKVAPDYYNSIIQSILALF